MKRPKLLRPRSMRWRVLLVVVAVVVSPTVFVWLSNLSDATVDRQLKEALEGATAETTRVLTDVPRQTWSEELDGIAWEHEVRIRVVDREGRSLVDRDREGRETFGDWFGALFFGPEGAPELRGWDEERGALHERPEFEEAWRSGRWDDCTRGAEGRLLVCQQLERVDLRGEEMLVVVQQSSRRAIRALYDARYQMLKLTLYTLPMGLLLAWWLGWRMVRPLERLRHQVLARTGTARAPGPVELDRADEFGDLATAFNTLLDTIAERNRAYEGFVADMAHELKNPVAAVRAAAESMQNADGLTPERTARLARVLAESSSRLDQLVSRFLELARAEAGLPNQVRSTVDVAALAAGLIASIGSDARYAEVTFDARIRPAVVSGVSERLETAMRNLLENAASFAADGGTVWLRVEGRPHEVFVCVRDSGPGISEADLPRVFDRFFTRRADDRGTGLGLALVRAIVDAHRGTIEVDSVPGEGATFTIRLPPLTPTDGRPAI